MKTIRLTTAQALIKFLNSQYISVDGKEWPFVEGIFSIFGHGNVLGIGHALENDPGHLKHFQGKNEQGMAHAAMGFAKQSLRQKIYAVTTSAGPGSANLIAAAGTAFANNIPVLLLPADTYATRQPDPVLQQLEHEHSINITTNDAFKAVTRYWDRITRPEQLMSSLIRAFEVLTNPAVTGPVAICIAQDVEGEAYDYDVSFFDKRVHYLTRQLPDAGSVARAVDLIKASKKPVMIVGGGAKYSEAKDELIKIAKQWEIPLLETQAGKSTVEVTFEYNLGGVGITGTKAANQAIMEVDLVIGVGTRYTDFTTSSKTIFKPDAKFLNINVNRMQSLKMDGVSVVADAKLGLQALLEATGGYKSKWGNKLSVYLEEWKVEWKRLAEIKFDRGNFNPEVKAHFDQDILNEYAEALDTELTQTRVIGIASEMLADDSVVVTAAGSLPGCLHRMWQPKVANTYHVEYGYSCMGYEIAGALGAKIAAPNQEVYSFVGDGSFQMLHSELVTAVQYGYKVNVLLFDNSGFGCINNLQMNFGNGSLGTEFRNHAGEVMRIDYAKVAEAYGMKVYRVHNEEDLKLAIADSKKQTVSTLIDIKVLPKTMTDGYEGAWWNLGAPEVVFNEKQQQALDEKKEKLKLGRQW